MTATHYDQLGEIYPTMLNELNCTYGVSFSRFHCCGRHGTGPQDVGIAPVHLTVVEKDVAMTRCMRHVVRHSIVTSRLFTRPVDMPGRRHRHLRFHVPAGQFAYLPSHDNFPGAGARAAAPICGARLNYSAPEQMPESKNTSR